ncbi:hypothetical protein [Calothrix sp. PCC 7507]|uniref:hypothetical protein n=1 Tax=Calothrix sp. PCC 7507 TaxID=99598 RepID=UPI00029F3DD2|nr:hypothetical protein [Calothrix sp. PCC 7507]AFY31555.1 hypothetical protein Cal7507_1079 [Calothrix sp. PCC 7507]
MVNRSSSPFKSRGVMSALPLVPKHGKIFQPVLRQLDTLPEREQVEIPMKLRSLLFF